MLFISMITSMIPDSGCSIILGPGGLTAPNQLAIELQHEEEVKLSYFNQSRFGSCLLCQHILTHPG